MVFGRCTLILFLCSTHPYPPIFTDKYKVGQILQSVEKKVDKSENATSKVKRGESGCGSEVIVYRCVKVGGVELPEPFPLSTS